MRLAYVLIITGFGFGCARTDLEIGACWPDESTCEGGICHGGACCTGCWDGTACQPGDVPEACGVASEPCMACRAPLDTCEMGECVASAPFALLDVGSVHSMLVLGGAMFGWGKNVQGQVGVGDFANSFVDAAMQVGADERWIHLSAGHNHTCGMQLDNTLWCWGGNDGSGQLGLGDGIARDSPTQVGLDEASPVHWSRVCAGRWFTCGIAIDGTLWCWGSNGDCRLGTERLDLYPQKVGVSAAWQDVVAGGGAHGCAIREDTSLWCWGSNITGQLGLGEGSGSPHCSPQEVGFGWKRVAAGMGFTCAIATDQTLWCWGKNHVGQLGLGVALVSPDEYQFEPMPVGDATNHWTHVAVFEEHACAIEQDGTLWCWGNNTEGRLGVGDVLPRYEPTQVSIASVVTVDVGEAHTCALVEDGVAWCWGYNGQAQLGNNNLDSVPHPSPERVVFEGG